jgi:hypothetical protein
VRIDCLGDWRSTSVAQSLLTQFLRRSETAHQSCVRVPESMEAIAPWHVDTARARSKENWIAPSESVETIEQGKLKAAIYAEAYLKQAGNLELPSLTWKEARAL